MMKYIDAYLSFIFFFGAGKAEKQIRYADTTPKGKPTKFDHFTLTKFSMRHYGSEPCIQESRFPECWMSQFAFISRGLSKVCCRAQRVGVCRGVMLSIGRDDFRKEKNLMDSFSLTIDVKQ
ncbi:MAG: hypothetical protein JSR44_10805 [Spirochaetes bacterium]|nr:hypothetical protein [Spirochaetota bacterium]